MIDSGLRHTVRFKDGTNFSVDEAMYDEAIMYLRDLLITRHRLAHRGRRRGELERLDRLIHEVMLDVDEMFEALYGDRGLN